MSVRNLLLLALVAGLSSASCGKVKIPDGALACKVDGGVACPDGYKCGADNLCHLKGGQQGDAGLDSKVDHPADVAGDVPAAEGGGTSCPALENPMGGTVEAPNLTPGSTATYSCTVGNKLAGAATRTCQANGTWDGAAPTCSPNDCGPLTAPTKGSVSAPMTTLGSVATYSCEMGFGPSGSSTRTCQADGWDGMQPTCVVANCPALPGPAGGSVSAPSLTFGSTATYMCNNGYTLNGTTTRTCQANMTWLGAAPTCTPKDCGAPPAPTHGTVSAPTTTLGGVATYMCSSGYTLSGAMTRTCQADQTWSATTPLCLPVDCGNISVASGSVTYSSGTTFGSSASYACNTNYQLMGTSPVTCQANGSWSGAPTCVDICTVAGNHGTTSHCCDNVACTSASAPTCNTGTRLCVATATGGSCGANSNCASGFCVANVCCGTACNGTCDGATCAGGTCEHASKQGVSCATRHLNQPTYNDIEMRCDASGNCKAPTIKCAGVSCDLNTKVCCMTSPPGNPVITCTATQSQCQCGTGGPCTSSMDQRWYGCQSNADCPNGQVCSAYINAQFGYGIVYTACFVSNTWPGGGNQFNNNVVCNPAKSGECGGRTCISNSNADDEIGYCN